VSFLSSLSSTHDAIRGELAIQKKPFGAIFLHQDFLSTQKTSCFFATLRPDRENTLSAHATSPVTLATSQTLPHHLLLLRSTTNLNQATGRGPTQVVLTMGLFSHPTSYRLNAVAGSDVAPSIMGRTLGSLSLGITRRVNGHESHPAIGHLMLLVFEAVMEVVCVSLPGYVVARTGILDADKQKFLAELNVSLFTPALSMCFDPVVWLALTASSLHKIGFATKRG
jgi:hypothetical protein